MPELTPNHDFAELSQLIEERRGRVTRLMNTELIDLYWELGKRIELRIAAHGWGRATVTELADYLASHIPGLRGFSSSNLWRMRQFYETWKDAPEKLATLLRELSWSAHLDLLGRCKTHEERQFYLIHAVQEGLSVRQLSKAIETANYERVSLTDQKPATVSRVLQPHEARQFKDSYVLDFFDLPEDHSEADLHQGLIRNLSQFSSKPGEILPNEDPVNFAA